eukprot:tig00000944_g5953.t1
MLAGPLALRLEGCGLQSVPEGVLRLGALERLSLACNSLIELPPGFPAALPRLRSLSLRGNPLLESPALAPLARLPALTSLDLAGTGVTSLSPLRGAARLEELRLEETLASIDDARALAGCPALARVGLPQRLREWLQGRGERYEAGAPRGMLTDPAAVDALSDAEVRRQLHWHRRSPRDGTLSGTPADRRQRLRRLLTIRIADEWLAAHLDPPLAP